MRITEFTLDATLLRTFDTSGERQLASYWLTAIRHLKCFCNDMLVASGMNAYALDASETVAHAQWRCIGGSFGLDIC
jgi:hypothetical protein